MFKIAGGSYAPHSLSALENGIQCWAGAGAGVGAEAGVGAGCHPGPRFLVVCFVFDRINFNILKEIS